MPKEMLISQFKAHCSAEVKRVQRTGQPLVVTLRGKPIARVDPVLSPGEPPAKLGRKRGQSRIKCNLVKFDFSDEWEINRQRPR